MITLLNIANDFLINLINLSLLRENVKIQGRITLSGQLLSYLGQVSTSLSFRFLPYSDIISVHPVPRFSSTGCKMRECIQIKNS